MGPPGLSYTEGLLTVSVGPGGPAPRRARERIRVSDVEREVGAVRELRRRREGGSRPGTARTEGPTLRLERRDPHASDPPLPVGEEYYRRCLRVKSAPRTLLLRPTSAQRRVLQGVWGSGFGDSQRPYDTGDRSALRVRYAVQACVSAAAGVSGGGARSGRCSSGERAFWHGAQQLHNTAVMAGTNVSMHDGASAPASGRDACVGPGPEEAVDVLGGGNAATNRVSILETLEAEAILPPSRFSAGPKAGGDTVESVAGGDDSSAVELSCRDLDDWAGVAGRTGPDAAVGLAGAKGGELSDSGKWKEARGPPRRLLLSFEELGEAGRGNHGGRVLASVDHSLADAERRDRGDRGDREEHVEHAEHMESFPSFVEHGYDFALPTRWDEPRVELRMAAGEEAVFLAGLYPGTEKLGDSERSASRAQSRESGGGQPTARDPYAVPVPRQARAMRGSWSAGSRPSGFPQLGARPITSESAVRGFADPETARRLPSVARSPQRSVPQVTSAVLVRTAPSGKGRAPRRPATAGSVLPAGDGERKSRPASGASSVSGSEARAAGYRTQPEAFRQYGRSRPQRPATAAASLLHSDRRCPDSSPHQQGEREGEYPLAAAPPLFLSSSADQLSLLAPLGPSAPLRAGPRVFTVPDPFWQGAEADSGGPEPSSDRQPLSLAGKAWDGRDQVRDRARDKPREASQAGNPGKEPRKPEGGDAPGRQGPQVRPTRQNQKRPKPLAPRASCPAPAAPGMQRAPGYGKVQTPSVRLLGATANALPPSNVVSAVPGRFGVVSRPGSARPAPAERHPALPRNRPQSARLSAESAAGGLQNRETGRMIDALLTAATLFEPLDGPEGGDASGPGSAGSAAGARLVVRPVRPARPAGRQLFNSLALGSESSSLISTLSDAEERTAPQVGHSGLLPRGRARPPPLRPAAAAIASDLGGLDDVDGMDVVVDLSDSASVASVSGASVDPARG